MLFYLVFMHGTHCREFFKVKILSVPTVSVRLKIYTLLLIKHVSADLVYKIVTFRSSQCSVPFAHHPPHSSSAKIEGVFGYSPSLFDKSIVVHARQICKQQQTH